jgi:hypothetical protein
LPGDEILGGGSQRLREKNKGKPKMAEISFFSLQWLKASTRELPNKRRMKGKPKMAEISFFSLQLLKASTRELPNKHEGVAMHEESLR